MKKMFILIILLLFFSIGCSRVDNAVNEGQIGVAYSDNYTPIIFLYPAIDVDSITPRYFENTTYEIILNNEKYLGKFEANKFNQSYLNLTYGDIAEMIVSAKDDGCEVINDVIAITAKKPIDYITPKLRCGRGISFDVEYKGELQPVYSLRRGVSENYIHSGRVITYNPDSDIRLTVWKSDGYNFLGCSYDSNLIHIKVEDVPYGIPTLFQMRKYDLREVYDLGDMETEGRVIYIPFRIYNFQESLNTTVRCAFFDDSFVVENYQIRKLTSSDSEDFGRRNPTFNFTVQYKVTR